MDVALHRPMNGLRVLVTTLWFCGLATAADMTPPTLEKLGWKLVRVDHPEEGAGEVRLFRRQEFVKVLTVLDPLESFTVDRVRPSGKGVIRIEWSKSKSGKRSECDGTTTSQTHAIEVCGSAGCAPEGEPRFLLRASCAADVAPGLTCLRAPLAKGATWLVDYRRQDGDEVVHTVVQRTVIELTDGGVIRLRVTPREVSRPGKDFIPMRPSELQLGSDGLIKGASGLALEGLDLDEDQLFLAKTAWARSSEITRKGPKRHPLGPSQLVAVTGSDHDESASMGGVGEVSGQRTEGEVTLLDGTPFVVEAHFSRETFSQKSYPDWSSCDGGCEDGLPRGRVTGDPETRNIRVDLRVSCP